MVTDIEAQALGFEWTSLLIDASDKVHFTALDYGSLKLYHYTNESGSWARDLVDGSSNDGGWNVILMEGVKGRSNF